MQLFISALALSLGLTTAGLAAGSYGLSASVLDPAALERATSSVLDDQQHSGALIDQLDHVLGVAVDAGVAANGDATYAEGVADKRARLRAAAESALNDPQLRGAVKRALASLQTNVGALTNGDVTVQGSSVHAALQQELTKQDPALAAALPAELAPVTISAKSADRGWSDRIRTVTKQAALIALALIVVGILVAPDRAKALQRVSRFVLFLGAVPILLFGLLPDLVLNHLGGLGGDLAGILQGGSANLVAVAWVTSAAGLLLFVASGAVAKRNALLGLVPVRH